MHANLQPCYMQDLQASTNSNYCTINDIEINPDFTLYNGQDRKNSNPIPVSPKRLKQRRNSSTADKFKSIFKHRKNKTGKAKEVEKACSDTEIRNPSPPNLDELYSKINRKSKLRKSVQVEMRIVDSPENSIDKSIEDKPYVCHSDPTFLFHSVDVGASARGKMKRLKTRSERGSGRRSQQEASSSDEENTVNPRISNLGTPTESTGPRPMLLFPPPPSRSPSDVSEVHSPRVKSSFNSLPSSPKAKPRNKYTRQSPSIVNGPQFDFQTSIDNSALLPEPEITIVKLKTNSSTDSVTEEILSPPTRDDFALVHPKKRLSVGSPPSSAKDLEESFLFPDTDTITASLPIRPKEPMLVPPIPPHPYTKHKVVTKVVSGVGKYKQPYVNLPQLVKTAEGNGLLPEGSRNKFREATESASSENTPTLPQDQSPEGEKPHGVQIHNHPVKQEIQPPPRPAKPPTLPNQPFKKTTLKSNLKQPIFYNSVSSTGSSNYLSKDSHELESNCSSRSKGLKVNFGDIVEIPITPNVKNNERTDPNNCTYRYPQNNNTRYQGYNSYVEFSIPYGGFPQHGHFASDPHLRQVMVPAPFYYPSSMHVPSLSMIPPSYDSLANGSFQGERVEFDSRSYDFKDQFNRRIPSYDFQDQFNGPYVSYNSNTPFYTAPPPFSSYSTDPNINELRSRAYSAYSGESYQSHSFKSKPYKHSRPAPAPPKTPPNSKIRPSPITSVNKTTGNTETMV